MSEAMASPQERPCIARRAFVGQSMATLLGMPVAVALASCASLMTRTVTPENGRIRLALTQYPELAEAGGSLKVVPEGTSEPIYVLSLGAGRYAALSPICTHLGCTVEIMEARLVCPCHGSTYDREGRVLQGPAERALARYETELSPDGVVVIALGGRT